MNSSGAILERVWADPQSALTAGQAHLETLAEDDAAEKAATLRAMSLAARLTNQLDDSIEYARSGAAVAATGGLVELKELNLLTLAGSLAIAGRTAEALELIEDALRTTGDDHMRARFQFQRGFVLNGVGEVMKAKSAFETALRFFRAVGDRQSIGSTLHNLGGINTQIGELGQAEKDLSEAMEIAVELGETSSIPGLEHNLGLLAAYRGDIPTALARLARSDDLYMEVTGAQVPQHVARSEVLISVGLFTEALALAKEIAEGNREAGDAEHEARALMVAAQAALLAGVPDEARTLADQARQRYMEQGRAARSLHAAEVFCEARYVVEGASDDLARQVGNLVNSFDDEKLLVPATQARLLAGRLALALDDKKEAERALGSVGMTRSGPPELRIQACLARALLRSSAGDHSGAAAAVRSGLRLLDDYQAAFAASDLRMGIERQGRELGEIGLGLALQSGRSRRILEWMDRTRARALRHRPVTAHSEDEVAGLMADLRRIDAELRKTESAGEELARRRRRVQEQITRADRQRRGQEASGPNLTTDALIGRLDGKTLVEMAIHAGRLFVVTVIGGRVRAAEIGAADAVLSELAHLRFGMRRAAMLGRAFDAAVLDRFDRLLLGSLSLGDNEVVIVPPGPLMSVPWSGLPRFREVPVTVSPSAEMWWLASQRAPGTGDIVVAGGPGLEHADAEVAAVAAIHQSARSFAPGSTVAQVGAALSGASLAHIASHASFQAENPMFSSLRLGDGELNVYDIERLDTPPATVVLSACDSGYTETRAGDELAGLTSALLSMGTRSVVASVGLVPDSPATSDLMVELHRGLAKGQPVSHALSSAQKSGLADPARFLAAASFVAVGA